MGKSCALVSNENQKGGEQFLHLLNNRLALLVIWFKRMHFRKGFTLVSPSKSCDGLCTGKFPYGNRCTNYEECVPIVVEIPDMPIDRKNYLHTQHTAAHPLTEPWSSAPMIWRWNSTKMMRVGNKIRIVPAHNRGTSVA